MPDEIPWENITRRDWAALDRANDRVAGKFAVGAGGKGSSKVVTHGDLGNVDWNFEEDIPLTNAKKATLTGGHWVTIEGTPVYIKGGKIATGPKALVGGVVKDVKVSGGAGTESDHGFSGAADAKEWVEKNFKEVKYTDAEENAIGQYQGATAFAVNDYLRHPEKPAPSYVKRMVDAIGSDLDAAIAKGEVKEAVTVYRGFSSDALPEGESAVGTVLRDNAYVSTTMDRDVTHRFLNEVRGQGKATPVLAEIRVPKGARAAYVDKVRDSGESELLFGRGTRLKVTEDRTEKGTRFVVLELQP